MVESIEELCQLERVFGQVCRFRGGDALVDYVRRPGGGQPQLPDFGGVSPAR